jgi:hypothetical protein
MAIVLVTLRSSVVTFMIGVKIGVNLQPKQPLTAYLFWQINTKKRLLEVD